MAYTDVDFKSKKAVKDALVALKNSTSLGLAYTVGPNGGTFNAYQMSFLW